MHFRIAAGVLGVASLAFGQRPVEVTAKIGVPIMESFQTSSYQFLATGLHQGDSATRRYTAGVGVILRLPHGFGAEFDVLYKRLGYDLNSTNPPIPVLYRHTRTTANSWEFPILGVYRFARLGNVQPRVSGGLAFRTTSGASTTGHCYVMASQYLDFCPSSAPVAQTADPHLGVRSSLGATFGAGFEARTGPIRLEPELRYARWRMDAGTSGNLFDLRSSPNQLDFLLGINF